MNALSFTLKPNEIFDSEVTELQRLAAAEAVEPTMYKEGQNIVQKGDVITEAQYELLNTLGYVSNTETVLPRVFSVVILLGVVYAVCIMYAHISDRALLTETKNALSIFLLTALTLLMCMLTRGIDERIQPTFLAVIVLTAMLRRRTVLGYGVVLSVIVAFCTAPTDEFLSSSVVMVNIIACVMGSTVAVLALGNREHRGRYILSGLLAGVTAAVVSFAFMLTDSTHVLQDYVVDASIYVGNGLVAGLLSVGVLPICESLFSLATPTKLLELANPGTVLLKRLMTLAPGTYHHSVLLANLAEAGCDAVGADALLARVGSYYHDIGKTHNPQMFTENQIHQENPHDSMNPYESAEVILTHVKNGLRLAKEYKLPKGITDIIAQHHGDGLVAYFYHKAKQTGGEDVDREKFRYPGPKPQTKEAGVVMLADTVEAAVRANGPSTTEELRNSIDILINAKFAEGQLDECPLNKKDLRRIADAFVSVTEGAMHERIKYPTVEEG